MEVELDNIIKTVTMLQNDIREIVEEYKLLLHPVQSQTWTSTNAYDNTRVVDVVIKNQENIELAGPIAIGSDFSSTPENGEQKDMGITSTEKHVHPERRLLGKAHQNATGDVTEETTEKEVPCDEGTSATNKKGNVTDGKSDSWTIGDLLNTRILRMMWPPSWFLSNKKDGGIKSRENHSHHESSHFDKAHQNASGDVTGETTEKEVPCDEGTSATNKKGNVTDGKSDSWTIGDLLNTRILRMMWPPSWFLSNKKDGGIKSRENHSHHESSHFDKAHQNASGDVTGETKEKEVPCDEGTSATNKKGNVTDGKSDSWTIGDLLNTRILRMMWPPSWFLSNKKDGGIKSRENHSHHESSPFGKSHQNGIELSKRNLSEKLEKFKMSFEQCLKQLQSLQTHFEGKFKALKNEKKNKKEQIMNINRNDHSDVREPNGENESRSSCPQASRLSGKTNKVVSQMYCPKPSDMATSVTKELSVMLTKHMKTHGIKLKMQIYRKVQDLQKDVPLILICLQSSRLGTDVKNAIKAIQTGPNVAVLIFHHADIHALPIQRSRKVLTAPEYKEIGTIIDMGFLSEKGIYECEMNKEALKDLTSFLKQ